MSDEKRNESLSDGQFSACWKTLLESPGAERIPALREQPSPPIWRGVRRQYEEKQQAPPPNTLPYSSPPSNSLALPILIPRLSPCHLNATATTTSLQSKSICNKFPQPSPITCMSWPDARPNEVVFGLAEGKVKIGQLKSNKPATLYNVDSFCATLATSPDGNGVVSAHADGTLYRFLFDDNGGPSLCLRITTRHTPLFSPPPTPHPPSGIPRVKRLTSLGYNIAVMCRESLPLHDPRRPPIITPPSSPT